MDPGMDVVSVWCTEMHILEVFMKHHYMTCLMCVDRLKKSPTKQTKQAWCDFNFYFFFNFILLISTDWGPEGIKEVNGHQCIQISHFA